MDQNFTMRRTRAYALCALLSVFALAVPATGWAASGGSGLTGGGPADGGSSAPGMSSPSLPQTSPATTTVSARGNGISVQTLSSAVLRGAVTFSGTAPSATAGETVTIERSGHETGWRWAPTASGTIANGGSFSVRWQANHIGRFAIRAVVSAPREAQAASATPSLTMTVLRPSLATLYGPGFYGHRTACGQRLGPGTIGVANRTLKCGTPVAIVYDGRMLVVPVIDRGPYANHADWDLTMATGRALGISGTAEIGAVSLPPR
jgi:rare lipoprotein A